MKLIANHTIQTAKFHPKDEKKASSQDRWQHASIAPGEEFDPSDHDIDTDQVKALVQSGAAREKGKFDDKPVEQVPVAQNTAQLGPASGQTSAPDPNAVAKAAASKA